MVYLTALWLPILLSAVGVFIASSVIHMVFTYHHNEYRKLPNEEKVLEVLRAEGLSPGNYVFPRAANPKDMQTPEMMEKYKKGPVGFVTVMPSGPPAMAKNLAEWFVFCLVIGVFVAYVTGRTLGAGAPYLSVFRIAGTVGFLGYASTYATDAIWKGQPWSTTLKSMFDGLIYALVTAGVFGWLWPR